MRNKVIGVILAICIFIGAVFLIIKQFKPDDNDKLMLNDSKEIMELARLKYYRDLMSDSVNITYKCYNINELGINNSHLTGINAKDYVGSVLVQGTSDNSRISIWLSDGKRMASGILNNVQITKSNEHATTNCNMTK